MPATLIVNCPEHLQKVRDFADRTNQRAEFEEKLEDLHKYVSGEDSKSACMRLRPIRSIGKNGNQVTRAGR